MPIFKLKNNGQIVITYDGDGNRMSKTAGGTTNYYLVDEVNPSGYAQVLEEYQGVWTNGDGQAGWLAPLALGRAYNYGLGLISQQQFDATNLVPSVLSYYGYDGHGSVRFLMDTNGSITDTYTYDAFGNLIASNGTTPNDYLYCGLQYDCISGLYNNRARWMFTPLGRFTSMDTYAGNNEDPLSLHRYLYAEDDPVDNTDPLGHQIDDLAVGMEMDAGLDAMPNIVTLSSALVPVEKASILVTTIIRPPDPEAGIKTQQAITVDSNGKISNVLTNVGTTSVFGVASLKGSAAFQQSASGFYPYISVVMTGHAHSAVLPPLSSIRYLFELDLDFSHDRGHLWGFNESYPSYTVAVNHRNIYDCQQKNITGLTRDIFEDLVTPNVDFHF